MLIWSVPRSPGKIYTANTANASDVSGRSRMSEMPEGIEGQKNKSRRCIRQKYGRSVMATNIGTWPLPHCSLLMSGPISAIKGSRAAHSVKWRSGNCEENSNFITHWNGQICAEMRSRHHCPKKSKCLILCLVSKLGLSLLEWFRSLFLIFAPCLCALLMGIFPPLQMKCYQNIRSGTTSLSKNLQPQKWSNFCQNLRMRKIHRGNPSAVANR